MVGEEYGARLIAEPWYWEGGRVRGRVVEEERSSQAYPGYLVLTRIHKLFHNTNIFSIFCLVYVFNIIKYLYICYYILYYTSDEGKL